MKQGPLSIFQQQYPQKSSGNLLFLFLLGFSVINGLLHET
jgi:hypothetical protein